jgi:hypothetical protein
MKDNSGNRKRAKELKLEKPASSLIRALKFINRAQSKLPDEWATHCVLNNGKLYASTMEISAGCLINEDLTAFPNTKLLKIALEQCGEQFTMTSLETGLVIQSGPFQANIPCANSNDMIYFPPDEPQGVISNTIKNGLKILLPLVREKGEFLAEASILITDQKMYSTNGKVIIEYKHGWNIPFNLVIGKSFAKAISKTKYNLDKIGVSDNSITFWFENGSFIRGNRFSENWPDVRPIFLEIENPIDIPIDFFEAVKFSSKFSTNGIIKFNDGFIKSELGQYNIAGLAPMSIEGKSIMFFKDIATKIEFSKNNRLTFIGENFIGIVSGE